MTADERLGETPSRIPAAHLGAAFGPPDRTSALSGQLTRPARPRPELQPEAASDTPKPAKRTGGRRASSRPAEADKPVPVQVIVYLPVSLKERLQNAARSGATTYTTVVLDAIDATHQRLDELLGNAGVAHTPRREGSLFGVQTTAATQPGREPHVQVSVRLLRRDVNVLDELATRHKVSRSALVAAALGAHLPVE